MFCHFSLIIEFRRVDWVSKVNINNNSIGKNRWAMRLVIKCWSKMRKWFVLPRYVDEFRFFSPSFSEIDVRIPFFRSASSIHRKKFYMKKLRFRFMRRLTLNRKFYDRYQHRSLNDRIQQSYRRKKKRRANINRNTKRLSIRKNPKHEKLLKLNKQKNE